MTFNKSIFFFAMLVASLSLNAQTDELVLSLAVPRIPSEARCDMANLYVKNKLVPIHRNLSAYKIAGNCALKVHDVKTAIYHWSKAALMGDELSLINIARISALAEESMNDREFGLTLFVKAREKSDEFKYLVKLFAALQLIAFSNASTVDHPDDKLTSISQLLIDAVALESLHNKEEAAMILRYLYYIEYFDSLDSSSALYKKVKTLANSANPHFCYMQEALKRDLYKLPKDDTRLAKYGKQCKKGSVLLSP